MPLSVHHNFVDYAKEIIYQRASEMGLSFNPALIVHERDDSGDVVYLKEYKARVVDDLTGEVKEIWQPTLFLDLVSLQVGADKPELVIARKPDGTVLDGRTLKGTGVA